MERHHDRHHFLVKEKKASATLGCILLAVCQFCIPRADMGMRSVVLLVTRVKEKRHGLHGGRGGGGEV